MEEKERLKDIEQLQQRATQEIEKEIQEILKQRKKYYKFMIYEGVDNSLLRLLESFLESAPQLTFQLFLMIADTPEDSFKISCGMFISWMSLAFSLWSYVKLQRKSRDIQVNMASMPFYLIWRASEIGGRVLCIAMFASACKLWVFGILIFHWMCMSLWMILLEAKFYKNKWLNLGFNIIRGYVMVFCFLNFKDGTTRFFFIVFYAILYIENFFMFAIWLNFSQDQGTLLHVLGVVVVPVLFVLHIVFQLLYFKFFHPTKAIKTCLP